MHHPHRRLPGLLHAIWAPVLAAVLALSILAATPETGTLGTRPHRAVPDRDGLSLVSSAPVDPVVREFPVATLTRSRGTALAAVARTPAGSRLLALSDPEPVEGFATVGLTWAHGQTPAEEALAVSVRTRTDGVWSEWQPMPYDPDHAPDPDSAEGQHAFPGTDAVVIGDTGAVQVKVETTGPAVQDLRLAVIDPGTDRAPVRAAPAIDTAALENDGAIALTGSAPGVTPKPRIFSRAQWGANESIRDKPSLHYFEVHAGFVHHTVNANGYTRDEVPSILRGIYAYHVQSRGWSDIGYNFLVDRFGRIWEGRYGGVDRPVVGAHTLGYNDYAFAASAIGNFQEVKPSAAMLQAYGELFAWKLSLHGVDASSTRQRVADSWFQAINGHRDAGQTACPGQYLYNRLRRIRTLASEYQHSWRARERQTDLTGDGWPDLAVRSTTDQQLYLLPTGGQQAYLPPVAVADAWQNRDLIVAPGDLTGDKIPDVLARDADSRVADLFPGTADGGLGSPTKQLGRFKGVDMLFGVGDWNRDGFNDLVGRNERSGKLLLFRGLQNGRFDAPVEIKRQATAYTEFVGKGDFNGDRRLDLVMGTSTGELWQLTRMKLRVGHPVKLAGDWSGFDLLRASTDLTGDKRPDVIAGNSSTGQTWIYPANGSGGFGHRIGPFSFAQGADTVLVLGDLTGGSQPDLLLRDTAGNVSVVAAAGTLNLLTPIATGIDVTYANAILNVGDFNGDGFGDVITRSSTNGSLWLRPGNGDGTFSQSVRISTAFGDVGLLVAAGDVTGDGIPDLMGQKSGGAMRIYPGDGTGGFKKSYVAHSSIAGNRQVGFGLFDGDGAPDSLIRRKGKLFGYRGNGPGGLITGGVVLDSAGQYDWLLGSGDVDGDGRADLIVRDSDTGALWFLRGVSSGFGARRFISAGLSGYDLAG